MGLFLKKRLVALLCIIAVCLAGCNTAPARPSDSGSGWASVRSIPFAGYVCGTEQDESFIQVLFLSAPNADLSAADIRTVCLSNSKDETTLSCRVGALQKGTSSEKWDLYTLSLHVAFPSAGTYWADRIELTLETGESVLIEENPIEFESLPYTGEDTLLNTFFPMSTGNYNILDITYKNQSDSSVHVLSIDAGSSFSGVKQMSVSYRDGTPADSSMIPPGEDRTFTFELDHNASEFQTMNSQFLLMLPKVCYETDTGEIIYAPGQHQATTVTPTMSLDYLDSVFMEDSP